MRKLPDGLRKESTKQSTYDKSSLELDLSELGIVESATTEKSEAYSTDTPQEETELPGEKFDELLIESIDEAISSLGEPVKNAFYLNLQNWSIKKKDIPTKLEEFSRILHKIFGLGACRLEMKFLKNLNSKIESDIKIPECNVPISSWIVNELSFNVLVLDIRKNYLSQNEKIKELSLQN